MSEKATSSGYLSDESQRRFTIWAGVLGVVFFLAQMFVPMIVMFAFFPGFLATSDLVSYECCGSPALLDGQYYLVEKTTSAGLGKHRVATRLVSLQGQEVAEVASLGDREPYLLATRGGLLLITRSAVGRLESRRLVEVPLPAPLGEISLPFLLGDTPAVVEYFPDRRRLLSWNGDQWVEVRSYESAAGPNRTRFLAPEGQLWEFRRKNDVLWFRDLDGNSDWETVSSEVISWSALVRGGHATAVVATGDRLRLLVRGDGGWQEERSEPFTSLRGVLFEAFDETPGAAPTLLTSEPFGGLRLRSFDEGGLADGLRVAGTSPFPGAMVTWMWLVQTAPALLSLVLAVVLSALMRSHRVAEVRIGAETVAYASLTRRAISQLADAAIALAPLALVGYALFSGFEDLAEGPQIVFWMFGAMAGAAVWLLLVLVAFSVGEGRWGVTPGKWATGIRVVGSDLRPCGFGRAFVRNLLKMVDGFFNYLIGILMVAFTPQWQRLGDLAARTIVIRVRNHRAADGASPRRE
ncbi:MAG: RDD family protein [Thermoanaerobaculia bacterium]|nr:MAG: RDD family protein [Thermoanaerobaculia bacterium]MBZ0101117.1 RDD family protein [Thermoanaerobaculia bacterium]